MIFIFRKMLYFLLTNFFKYITNKVYLNIIHSKVLSLSIVFLFPDAFSVPEIIHFTLDSECSTGRLAIHILIFFVMHEKFLVYTQNFL